MLFKIDDRPVFSLTFRFNLLDCQLNKCLYGFHISVKKPFVGQLQIALQAFLGMIYEGHFLITVRARFFRCIFSDEYFVSLSDCLPINGVTSDVFVKDNL